MLGTVDSFAQLDTLAYDTKHLCLHVGRRKSVLPPEKRILRLTLDLRYTLLIARILFPRWHSSEDCDCQQPLHFSLRLEIKTRLLDALAGLVRARVALRGGRAREVMTMDEAQHLHGRGP